jgi:hypothetical protein
MQITVARVKHVHDTNVVSFADFCDETKNLGHFGPWNDTILSAVTWTQAADRTKCLFAALPQQRPFFLGL